MSSQQNTSPAVQFSVNRPGVKKHFCKTEMLHGTLAVPLHVPSSVSIENFGVGVLWRWSTLVLEFFLLS